MNIRDFIVPALLTFATLYMVNTFFAPQPSQEAQVQPGQSFTAAQHPDLLRPINTEVDFADDTLTGQASEKQVTTPLGYYQFTNATGGIGSLQFTHPTDRDVLIQTLDVTQNEWEDYAFLTALDTYTPFYYTLEQYEDTDATIEIVYTASSSQARIRKAYTVHKNTYQVDCALTVEPLQEGGCAPRMFIPAPRIQEIARYDEPRLIVYNNQNTLTKHAAKDLHNQLWVKPSLFGVENRYFVHTMIADEDSFVQRAYARLDSENGITSILEGPRVTEKQTWTLSFYCGPKEVASLAKVDSRLEETLEYGWFAPVSKTMVWLLKWMHEYVGNYGWAIILLTVIIRLLLLPFAVRGEASMKSSSGDFARKKKQLEHKYKDDQETLMREQYKLAKEHGMMPSMMGCLPMLLQVPVFIGLNYALRNSIVLYKAPFIGWIHDLSAPDPYYVLPILIGGSLFITAMNAQQKQQKMAMSLLAVLLVGFTSNFSAGLALYIAASSILGVMQTTLAKKLKA